MADHSATQARTPDALYELFEKFLNAGDREAIVAMYEPSAALVDRDGTIIAGAPAIGEFLRGLMAIKPRIRIQRIKRIDAGDIAVLISKWEMTGTAPDGSAITDGGQTYDIVRRQTDGTWKTVMDNPWSTMAAERY